MPLDSTYVGTVSTWPQRFVSQDHTVIPTTNGVGTSATPALLVKQTFTAPATIVTNWFATSHAGAGSAGTTSMTLAHTSVATPRNVVITVTHATAVVAMSGTITGTDTYGKTITEAWSVTATGTTKTFTGAKAFATVTSITETVAADASANTIIAGTGKKLGLNFRASNIIPVMETEDGATPTAGVIVAGAGSSATADWRGTYAPNSTLNGALTFVIYYITDDPTDI